MCKMKDSGIEWIGEIPKKWDCIRGKNLYSIATGKRDSGDYDENGLYPFFTCSSEEKRINSYCYDGEALLISGNGMVGFTRYYNGKFDAYQRTYYLFNFKKDVMNIIFLKHYVSNMLAKCLENQYVGSVIDFIKLGDLKNFNIVTPPICEQTRIADFLDNKCTQIDRYIEKQQQIIEKLKEYKQAIITEAVTKGLDPHAKMKNSGIEWIGEIPEQWNVCKFGYIATVKSNLVHPELYKSYPQVSSENIEKNSGKLLECKTVDEVGIISDNHLFYEGQILYSKIRPALNKVTIAPFDGLCSADIYPIETTEKTRYILYLILSEPFLQQVKTITENRVKMPKINRSELNSIFVAYPSEGEQEAIIQYLDDKCASIDEVIQKREYAVNKLTEYKKSLIYEAVTGKLDIV